MEFSIEPTAEDELEIVLTEDNDEEESIEEDIGGVRSAWPERTESPQMQMQISDEEYAELESTIHELMYDKINENPLLYSNPDFHENIFNDIYDLFYKDWIETNVIAQNEDIYECVSEIVESFFDLYYPPRSITNSEVISHKNFEYIAQTIEWLRSLPQPAQKTVEWHEYRHNMITGSTIWKALSTESQRNSLIYEKCKPFNPFAAEKGNWHAGGSLQWGVLYEAVSIMIYEKKYNTKVAEFGCIQHPKYKCIGASPDGINVDPTSDRYGRMTEVKNIVNRDITDKPKEEYWIQMQVQMETCDLDECDFIETRFKEYDTPAAYAEDTAQEWKGIILCFLTRDVPNSKPTYKYMPFDLEINHETWIANMKEEVKEKLILYTTTYWYLDEFSCILVKRNPLWFQAALPKILDTWDTIVSERETGYEHRAAKKRAVTNCQPNADGSYIISNLKVNNSVCLLKLDHD
jgi:hypothetical protein